MFYHVRQAGTALFPFLMVESRKRQKKLMFESVLQHRWEEIGEVLNRKR